MTRRHPIPSLLTFLSVLLASTPIASLHADENMHAIVVTATREAQDLRNYAGSVSLVTNEEMALVGSTHHSEIINRAAGAMIQRNSGQESLTAIRSPVLSGPGSCGAFLFLENSIPIRPVGFCNVNELFEINTDQAQSIEVLRGPAGVVYGSGAMHGAVNIIPAAPSQVPARGIAVEVGENSYYRSRLVFSDSAGQTQFGGNAVITDDGGWRENAGLEEQKVNLALRQELLDGTFSLYFAGTNLQQETAGFIQGQNTYQDNAIARSNQNPEAYRDAYALRLTGHYERDVNESWQLDVRPYVRRSRMDFLQHFLIGKPTEENGQHSIGVNTSLTGTAFSNTRLMGGIDLELADGFLKETQAGPAIDGAPAANAIRPAGKHYDYTVRSTVTAMYGQIEQPIAQRWLASGGLRFEHVAYDYDNRMIAGNTRDDGTLCGAACLYNRPADRSDDFNNITSRLGLTYQLTDSNSLYVTASRGYRAPDTSELYRLQRQQSIAELSSERIDSLEAGARGRFGPVRYSVAAFTMKKDHVIFRDANAFNVSDGKTDHAGVEYEFTWPVVDRLTLFAAGTYAKHQYAFDRAIEGGETIVSGRDVDTAPRHINTARATWRFLPSATAEVEWQSIGRYWLDAVNAHDYGGHELLNLRVAWNITDSWSALARLNNVADRAYADRADFAFGNYRYFPGRGRSLFIEVRYASR